MEEGRSSITIEIRIAAPGCAENKLLLVCLTMRSHVGIFGHQCWLSAVMFAAHVRQISERPQGSKSLYTVLELGPFSELFRSRPQTELSFLHLPAFLQLHVPSLFGLAETQDTLNDSTRSYIAFAVLPLRRVQARAGCLLVSARANQSPCTT